LVRRLTYPKAHEGVHLVAAALEGSRELGDVHGHPSHRDGVQALPGQDSDLHPVYRSRCVNLRVCGASAAIPSKLCSSDSRLRDMPCRHARCRRNDSASSLRTKRELTVIPPPLLRSARSHEQGWQPSSALQSEGHCADPSRRLSTRLHDVFKATTSPQRWWTGSLLLLDLLECGFRKKGVPATEMAFSRAVRMRTSVS